MTQFSITTRVHKAPRNDRKKVNQASSPGFFQEWTNVGTPPTKLIAIVAKTAIAGELYICQRIKPIIAPTKQMASRRSIFLSPVFQPNIATSSVPKDDKNNKITVGYCFSNIAAAQAIPVTLDQIIQVTILGRVVPLIMPIR